MKESEEGSLKSWFVPFTTTKAISFIILIGFTVYFNVFFNGFVGDDNGQILQNPLVHSLKNFPLFFKGSTLYLAEIGQSAGLYYRPLMSTFFALIYSVSGPTPFLFHLAQLAFHIANCILVFLIFRRHVNLGLTFVLSLVFLVHPINNEAVVYISNFQEELFAFFGLMALITVKSKRFIYASPIFLVLSLLSKETGFIFLPLTIMYYFLFVLRTKDNTRFLMIGSAIATLSYVLIRIVVGNTGLQTKFLYMSTHATFIERLFTLPSILTYYLKMLLFPYPIAFGWYWVVHNPNFSNFAIPLIIVLLVLVFLTLPILKLLKKPKVLKEYLFFFSVLLLGVGIVSQIFPLDLTVADRWFYMPLFGILGMIGIILKNYSKSLKSFYLTRTTSIVLVVILLSLYAIISFSRTLNWSNSYTLCSHDVKVNTKSYILEYCTSSELYNRKEYDKAQMHALNAINLYPGYFLSWYTLGNSYYALGNSKKAEEAFHKTLEFNEFGLGSQELALILAYNKDVEGVKKLTSKYLKILPNSSELWYALALAYYQEGNQEKAVEASEKAYKLEPTPITLKLYTRLKNNLPINF